MDMNVTSTIWHDDSQHKRDGVHDDNDADKALQVSLHQRCNIIEKNGRYSQTERTNIMMWWYHIVKMSVQHSNYSEVLNNSFYWQRIKYN
jgi:hypothetical protein